MSKSVAIIALGSNAPQSIDDKKILIQLSVDKVECVNIKIESQSRYFETPAYPAGLGPDFINAAISVRTNLSPEDLMVRLHNIEAQLGRERPYRWAPRTMDMDLLFFDDVILPDPARWHDWAGLSNEDAQKRAPDQLILPHPRLHMRGFVLAPLCDIAPNWVHPVLGKTVRELWEALPDQSRGDILAIE